MSVALVEQCDDGFSQCKGRGMSKRLGSQFLVLLFCSVVAVVCWLTVKFDLNIVDMSC